MLRNGEESFFLAAGVAVAALETHQGANTTRAKKPHQGIFSKNRRLRFSAMWAKWSGTHQDRSRSWWKTVLGSALDANGDTLSDPSGKAYTWDFENRLMQAVVPGTNGGTTTFKYDPFGRRIQKVGPLGTTNYQYDGDNLLEEMDAAGNVLARYTQTQRIDEPLAMLRSATASYYESDGLWSITSLSTGTGTVANTYTYDSFGNITNVTGTLTNHFRFTGREFDVETNLQFSRHRYYDPSIGRFLAEDLIRFEEKNPNLYWYVRNGPTNLVDPLGLLPCNGGFVFGAAAMWDNYERMKQRNWKGDDLYYHCMGNCQATNTPCNGSAAAAVISFFRTNVWGRATEDDWRDDDRANKCGQQGGDCNKTCAPFVPKSRPGRPPFPGW